MGFVGSRYLCKGVFCIYAIRVSSNTLDTVHIHPQISGMFFNDSPYVSKADSTRSGNNLVMLKIGAITQEPGGSEEQSK